MVFPWFLPGTPVIPGGFRVRPLRGRKAVAAVVEVAQEDADGQLGHGLSAPLGVTIWLFVT